MLNNGVASLDFLRHRFHKLHSAAEEASLRATSPKPNSIWSHFSAKLFSWMLLRERKVLQGNDDHARLNRADFFLKNGNLNSAVNELEAVSAPTAEVVADWLRQAKDRLVVEQAVKVLQAQALLLMESFAPAPSTAASATTPDAAVDGNSYVDGASAVADDV